jgi:S-adenosyl methyltransferase
VSTGQRHSSDFSATADGALRPGSSPADVDTQIPNAARIWNYWLGGKDNYDCDRVMGDRIAEMYPSVREEAREGRQFLRRAVRFLAQEEGVWQFLDIGAGLPTEDNVHDVAQAVAPEARVVYVDIDPVVWTHAQALMVSSPEGRCTYVHADLRDVHTILDAARQTLDFDEPVCLVLVGVIHHLTDDAEVARCFQALVDAVPIGSWIVIKHASYMAHRTRRMRW